MVLGIAGATGARVDAMAAVVAPELLTRVGVDDVIMAASTVVAMPLLELLPRVGVDDVVEMPLGDVVGDVESSPVGDAENTSELQPRCLFSLWP